MRIAHFNHVAHYARDSEAINTAIQNVLVRGSLVMGPEVAEFEAAFATLCDVHYAIGVMSGTAALVLALKALDIGPGDEVVTVANSDIPTSHAITHTGARIVYADINQATYNLDPAAFAAAITTRTRAVLPVHLYGAPADMDEINKIAAAHNLAVIEDAALATGASYRGRPVGGLGTIGAFSTAPGKVLGGVCSGGVITTNDADLRQRLDQLRYYGRERSPYPGPEEDLLRLPTKTVRIGFNERINTLDAAVLLIRLRRLPEDLSARRANRARHLERFAGSGVHVQAALSGTNPAWRVVTIRIPERDRIYTLLRRAGVGVTLPYLPPNHLDVCYRDLGYRPGDLPETEAFCDELLALPCHQYVSLDQVDEVADLVLASR